MDKWMMGKDDAAEDTDLRKFAIKTLIAYGYGKPRQAIDISGQDGKPIPIILYKNAPEPKN